MDSAEKLAYVVGFMDCWGLTAEAQGRKDHEYKRIYIIEKLIPKVTANWTDEQVQDLYQEIISNKLGQMIVNEMQSKIDMDNFKKELEKKSTIDWKSIMK